jgi:hypothetical protein
VAINRWLVTVFGVYWNLSVMALFVAAFDCRPFSYDAAIKGFMHLAPGTRKSMLTR